MGFDLGTVEPDNPVQQVHVVDAVVVGRCDRTADQRRNGFRGLDDRPAADGARKAALIGTRNVMAESFYRQKLIARIVTGEGKVLNVPIICRIDTVDELDYFKNGGILHYVLRDLAA